MDKLKELLKYGVTASHVIDYMKKELVSEADFTELDMEADFVIEAGGSYYVNLYDTNGMAFRVGENISDKPAFRIGMAHSDYPCFRVKPNATLKRNRVSKLNVEIYGGLNQKSWMDRPLGIAGKVIAKGENSFAPKVLLYKSDTPLAIVPSLAIHMDRELNKKGELDVAKELAPIVALDDNADLMQVIADSLHIHKEDILDYDLFLYNMEEPVLCGMDGSMLVAPKLDNLTSVAALVAGIKGCCEVPENTIDMIIVYDNEEVGSRTAQGADSQLLNLILEKVGNALSLSRTFMADVAKKSFLLSVDVAHANHPNYEEKSDVTNKAYMGQGFSLKRSIGQKYGTTAESAAVVKSICEKYDIPYTIAVNKTGIAGGSTLGPIVTSYVPFPCADIGIPILAMHSATELGAVVDYEALKNFIKVYFTL